MRSIWGGYYFVHSNRPGYGDWPEAVGNCEVVVEVGVIGRTRKPVILADRDDYGVWLLDEAVPHWARVVAIYCVNEAGDAAAVNAQALAVKTWMQARGLPVRPVLSYTAKHVYPTVPNVDWTGIQVYLDTPDQDPEAIASKALAQLPSHAPVVLIVQAYDRARPDVWSEADLVALQPKLTQLARDHPQAVGLLWFAYGRPGGVAQYRQMEGWHAAFMQEMTGGPPAILSLTPPAPSIVAPTVTIDGWTPTIRRGEPWEVRFHDPQSTLRGRVWLRPLADGTRSVHVRLENDRGGDQSGKTRVVTVEGV